MTLPTVVLRIGFASDPLDSPQTWSDVSRYGQMFSIRRGRQQELGRMEAGVASIRLKNDSGVFWPDNASGAYYNNVKPGKQVNIRATYGVTTYDLYTGFVAGWNPNWLSDAGKTPVMDLDCVDLTRNLSRHQMTNAGEAAELSGTRVGNVLDDYGWDAALRDIDNGQSTIQATGAQVNVNALSHLFNVQASESGIMYIAGDGDVQFEDRTHRQITPHTVSQATFGDDAGESSYKMLAPSFDDEYIYNTVTRTRVGGTLQSATDAASTTAYGPRTDSVTGLLMTSDGDALSQAQYILSRYKDPVLRAKSITIYPQARPADLWPKVLGFDISTRITLRLNQASLDKDYFIEGISHDVNAQTGTWATTWQLSEADNQVYWALGVAGYSELGETTKLFY